MLSIHLAFFPNPDTHTLQAPEIQDKHPGLLTWKEIRKLEHGDQDFGVRGANNYEASWQQSAFCSC